MTVIREIGRARIEVRDNGAAQAPAVQLRIESSERGRGLDLVEVLANRWGYRGSQHGRTVFFEITWTALV